MCSEVLYEVDGEWHCERKKKNHKKHRATERGGNAIHHYKVVVTWKRQSGKDSRFRTLFGEDDNA